MRAVICENTYDLHLYLSLEDITKLEGESGFLEILTAKDKGYLFWLRKERFEVEPVDGLDVIAPRGDPKDSAWHIKLTEEIYLRLVQQREIGTRFNYLPEPSKLKIIVQ